MKHSLIFYMKKPINKTRFGIVFESYMVLLLLISVLLKIIFQNNIIYVFSTNAKSKRKAMNRNWCNQKANPNPTHRP